MGGEETDKEEEPPPVVEPFPGVSLVDAPILFLLLFHKAQRAELADLRRIAVEASESGSHGRDLVVDLCQRFEFLKLVFQYHSAAEDVVIFQALDIHIKNVVCAYSLEHTNIDELFDSVFKCLNFLKMEDEDISKPFQELVFSIGTIQTTICQHMLKEEEQVFPLLMKNFSSKEQGSLVWQVMCSIPIMLLEDFLLWMTSFLSPDERVDVTHCVKEVVPKEKLLQEVVISWLDSKERYAFGSYHKYGKGQFPDELNNLKDMLKVHASKSISEEEFLLKKEHSTHKTGSHNPIGGIRLWHGAICNDLREILEELCQISSTNSFAEVIVQLNFFADVLVFYRNALDKIFYPLWNELAKDIPSLFCERFLDGSGIESLQKLLYYDAQSGIPSSNFVDKLRRELELFEKEIGKLLNYLETEVFPIIIKNCSHEMQQWILYKSLHMMPLGLLKCMITWFSAHLSEDESKSILYNIKQGGHLTNKSFASILYEWVRTGYSGKTSVENFRKGLRDMFNSRGSFLPEQIKNRFGISYSQSGVQPCNRYNPGPSEQSSVIMDMNCVSNISSSGSEITWKYDTSYSSGINMHIFFPQTLKKFSPLSESSDSSSFLNFESKPVDFIFFFHKALKKDLEYLVLVSAKLAENVGFLTNFHQRFHLVRFLYEIHSDSEDVIAFPALEAKGKLQNISHSYTIDHKLEVKQFNNISHVLDEISGLKVSVPKSDLDVLGQRMIEYRQLCIKLHDLCKSMHKILIDHVHREEIELWPLFRECFSIEEQEKIIGRMLGRTRAEILQEMIPWLMASLTPEEQNSLMSLWRKVTRNTMFEEWLREWWEGMKSYHIAIMAEESNIPPWTADPLEVISTYLMKEGSDDQGGNLGNEDIKISQNKIAGYSNEPSRNHNVDDKAKVFNIEKNNKRYSDCTGISGEVPNKNCNEVADVIDQVDKTSQLVRVSQKLCHQEKLLMLSQEELEAAIRRVSRDSTLDLQKKSYILQNLLTSRWFVTQQKSHPAVTVPSNKEEVPGQSPSYRDPLKSIFGCKHYKRNCKLVAHCCGKLYTCIHCHDDLANHSMDRKSITEMMCMKCLTIQPIGPTCSTGSCHNFSMARYYCRICKLFDDEREIYHCPYCNLCRVGKGLGIDYFHCMNCNACMSRSLSIHICREKSLEENCPICHEYIFTSCSPVKALPCGHLMHSACFQDYTYTHYTCPICSKSLGDMQVYFGMLDALLAEEKMPEEYSGQTQVILCNDCEKRGTASFHWLYHKCSPCGSYNTRLL